jgi:DNA-binding Lrp family transcriptional regulator
VARRPHIPLDEADYRIIELLTADGRASNRLLAAEVDLTEATVATRLRRLVDQRILGVTAIFDWEAAGYHWDLWLAVSIEGRPPRDVAKDVAALTHVHSVSMVLGPFDLIVHVMAPDRADVVRFLTERIGGVRGVRDVTSDVTLAWVKYNMNWAALPAPPVRLDFPDPVLELDELDLAVISALAHDGRQSNREIGRQLGVSDGTIRARLRRMEDVGMLRITAQVDPYRVGTVGAWAFLGVETEGADTKATAEQLAAIPEISLVAITAGRHDLFVHAATSTRTRLVDLIVNELRELPGIRTTETWEVVSNVVHDYRWVRLLPGQAPAKV